MAKAEQILGEKVRHPIRSDATQQSDKQFLGSIRASASEPVSGTSISIEPSQSTEAVSEGND